MAATKDQSPRITASLINSILVKTVSNMTLQDIKDLLDGLNRIPQAYNDYTVPIGPLFPSAGRPTPLNPTFSE
jgi:hypothetical protein